MSKEVINLPMTSLCLYPIMISAVLFHVDILLSISIDIIISDALLITFFRCSFVLMISFSTFLRLVMSRAVPIMPIVLPSSFLRSELCIKVGNTVPSRRA